jgi:hypothetical protein
MPFLSATIHNPKASMVPNISFIIISTLFLADIFVPRQIFTFILGTYFLMNTATSVLSANSNIISFPQTLEESSIVSTMESKQMVKKNDIFLNVYEAYANYETMLRYGFDNKAQIMFLENNGFEVYHGIYSLGAPTIPSMSKVFNMESEKFDGMERTGRKIITGSGSVYNILRKKGYRIHGVFQHQFFFRGLYPNEMKMDFFFPDFHNGSSVSVFIEGILTGSFNDRLSIRGVGFNKYLEKKHMILNQKNVTPKFVYTHSIYPGHSLTAGIIPSEQDQALSLYIKHIQAANDEMCQDVNLLAKNNPEAIVIIAGDHGPFMTKQGYGLHKGLTDYRSDDIDRFDIQDRFGAFLAIRWPEHGYAERYDIKILQDIFPAVFSYLFNDDTLFETIRIKKRTTVTNHLTLGVYVDDGMIIGGNDDGKPLFEGIQ